jgi:NAD(P)H-hydrate epimerase
MMYLANTSEIREMDRVTIDSGISSVKLMEKAAKACFDWLKYKFTNETPVLVFCGSGNNGGDGYALALFFKRTGYNVKVVETSKQSADATYYRSELVNEFADIDLISFSDYIPHQHSDKQTLILDCVLGSGLKNTPNKDFQIWIQLINQSPKRCVVAIDGPSGLNLDEIPSHSHIVCADFSLVFQLPRAALFYPECEKYIGSWTVLDIGLKHLDSYQSKTALINESDIVNLYKPRSKFAHKGIMGHSALLCGSSGKHGAALISAAACLKGGSGKVSLYSSSQLETAANIYAPECMFSPWDELHIFSEKQAESFDAIGIGPGISHEPFAVQSLKNLIHSSTPLVIDADGLNLLAENQTWLSFLSPNTILTPHIGEFDRLAGKSFDSAERFEKAKQLAMKYGCTVVLKGAYSRIFLPDGNVYVNSTGNAGMASGGMGDALTGLITALLAQGYSTANAALMGVFIHGLAADLAIEAEESEESITATTVINYFGKAFKYVLTGQYKGL